MKQLFFLFGLSAISYGSSAQQQGEQHLHTGNRYGVSVFTNSHNLHPEKRVDIGMYAKLAAQFPKWYIATDRWTGGFKDLNGAPVTVPGKTLEEKVINLMNSQLAVAGIKASEWQLEKKQTTLKGFTYLYYYQEVAGKRIAFTKMNFRFTPDGKIARINMKGYGNPDVSLVPVISTSKAVDIATAELNGAIISSKNIDENWEWFPIPSGKGFQLHPAFKFSVEGKSQESGSVPLNLSGYVDALTGDLLYRDNEVKEADSTDLKIVGNVLTDGYLNPPKVVGLPYVTVKIGATTLLADNTGFVGSNAFPLPTVNNITLEGRWSQIRSAQDANRTPSAFTTVSSLGTTFSFPLDSPMSSSRHINAYYHVNTVHDFMKSLYGTSFTGMDYALQTNVDMTSGTCNAFFTAAGSSSINFYAAGGGCLSFTEVRDVVYHEYGHAIVSKLYSGGMRNGGLNEGQADIWAMSITKDGVMARGSSGTPSSFIRRYDLAPKVYPKDLTGEVHDNGEIIAGAWWDYGKNVGSVDAMSKLFAACLQNEQPDGPNGTEGEVFHEMLMAALINDDDDGDLTNGTPHFTEIESAFRKHGIYLLQDLDIEHTELAHQPKGLNIPVSAKLLVSNPSFFKGLNLMYRTSRAAGFTWNKVAMADAGGYNFSAIIPAQSEGTIVDYYFAAEDFLNQEGVFFPYNYFPESILPANKTTLNYMFGVGLSAVQTIDFESPLSADWQIGVSGDNATTGKWIQAIPVASSVSGRISQTGNDHTTGSGKCLVTGNAAVGAVASAQSVKNGTTTVISPIYDLTSFSNPIVQYYRWYGNDLGSFPKKQAWRTQLSSGSIIYKDVENTNQSDYQWRRVMFKPWDLFPGATKMQLRFLAVENPTIVSGIPVNGLVEAAVDDIVIYEGIEGLSSINEPSRELAKIYPNPSVNVLNIVLPSVSYKELSISFYDISGKLVSSVPITQGATKYAVDTKGMLAGQYLVVIQMDKTIQTHKVTIQAQ